MALWRGWEAMAREGGVGQGKLRGVRTGVSISGPRARADEVYVPPEKGVHIQV